MFKERVTIAIGPSGEWGSAFALVAARKNHQVRLLMSNASDLKYFQETRQTPRLKGFEMPQSVKAFHDIKNWIDGSEIVVIAVPSLHFRSFVKMINPFIPKKADRVILTKGLEQGTHLRMSEIMLQENPACIDRLAALSGPNQAREIAAGDLAGAVVAAHKLNTAERIQRRLNSDHFCVYTSEDVAGVEYGAAFKNVTALGAGIADALKVSSSTKSFYLTRALEEMTELGSKLGAHESTFRGLAGYGDLSLSCYGNSTRNYRGGLRLAEGWSFKEVEAEELREGLYTLKSAMELTLLHKIHAPIISALYDICYKEISVNGDINQLLGRQRAREQFGGKGLGFKLKILLRRLLHNSHLNSFS